MTLPMLRFTEEIRLWSFPIRSERLFRSAPLKRLTLVPTRLSAFSRVKMFPIALIATPVENASRHIA
jgi:hypothetical protein